MKRDAEAKGARRSEGTVSRDETRANTPPLVDEALFFGGSAWAALEATSRLLAPTELDAKFETTSREFCKNAAEDGSDYGPVDTVRVAGSPEDAALAADVVASALLRLAGHESVSLGARGLRALAKILGKAAALVRGKGLFVRRRRRGTSPNEKASSVQEVGAACATRRAPCSPRASSRLCSAGTSDGAKRTRAL